MGLAVRDGLDGVGVELRSVHRLQKEMREVKALVALGFATCLPEDELQLVASRDDEVGLGLRAHADPIDAVGYGQRAVRLDGDLEAAVMQRVDERRVELQQRL